jgi:hypothetical protein
MFRSALAVLVGAVALAAIASASASAALPEFQQGGKTLEKTVKITEATGGFGKLESVAGITLSCTSKSLTGETHGANEVTDVVIKLSGCSVHGIQSHACTSTGAKSGEIVTTQLSGKLGYISKASKNVGLLLQPSKGELIAECRYGSGEGKEAEFFKLKGSIIGAITPANEEITKFSVHFEKTAGGKQVVTHFEGEEATHTLELTNVVNGKLEKGAWEEVFKLTGGEAMEIKA